MCKYQIVKIMMDWKRLISAKRFGMEEFHEERQENRSEFQRDYDRLVFSAPFRRLQTWFRRKICSSPRRTLFLTEERPFPHRGTKASTTGNFKNDYSSQIFPSSISTKPFLFPDIDSSSFSILSGKNAISVSGWKYCFKNVG